MEKRNHGALHAYRFSGEQCRIADQQTFFVIGGCGLDGCL